MPLRDIVRQVFNRKQSASADYSWTLDKMERLESRNAELEAENFRLLKKIVRLERIPKQKMGGCVKDWQKDTEV